MLYGFCVYTADFSPVNESLEERIQIRESIYGFDFHQDKKEECFTQILAVNDKLTYEDVQERYASVLLEFAALPMTVTQDMLLSALAER